MDMFLEYLRHLYHDRKMMMGRDRLYKYVQANRPDLVRQGLSRRFVMRFLESQECHQLFKPVRALQRIQPTVPKEPFSIVGMDLIDMRSSEVRGYSWALTAIDLFTHKGYCVPLKSKSAEDVVRGLALMLYGNTQQIRIHKHGSTNLSKWTITRRAVKPKRVVQPQMRRPPKHLRSDNGPEFKNALFAYFLKHHTTRPDGKPITQHWTEPHTPQANGCCERFNGFLKRQLKMQSVQHDDNDWAAMLSNTLQNINSTWCRVTTSTPIALEDEFLTGGDTHDAREQIIRNVSKRNAKPEDKPHFDVGDKVRVRLYWIKSSGLNWSHRVYTISRVIKGRNTPLYRHIQYKLKDEDGEVMQGTWRHNELQRYVPVDVPVKGKETFVVGRLVRSLVQNGEQMFEVAWQGYKDHTIEPRTTLMLDVPHLVKAFERE